MFRIRIRPDKKSFRLKDPDLKLLILDPDPAPDPDMDPPIFTLSYKIPLFKVFKSEHIYHDYRYTHKTWENLEGLRLRFQPICVFIFFIIQSLPMDPDPGSSSESEIPNFYLEDPDPKLIVSIWITAV